MLRCNGGIRLNEKLSEDDYYDDPHADKSDNGIINSYRSDPTDEDREDFKRTMEERTFKEGNLGEGLDNDDTHFLELLRGRR